mmetsp:Transcript_12707/g.17089  ORF Transcript_12707/g.17089 Transcript_12707/m.17089 type:complete len:126 (-) Transcript_12707:301-678(-)|eukprot:CAMPEP_0197294396 /NCGR_PEP_ID=MMETSP0890-20130614/32259_1 /TAXON_ID=44058 ORGANISM="Aureoumbra lagunensis, Strain CCMP1510" /NCGR_SAMPLE_ID=MMETSP0890 /ASSEMBLY_ACC=CAM_ASM_000533 /LENGTH=125 /DNA_ID=CAMNT_0042769781 /DNA_START=247 /DNA_END=624 /DNA_ORIENTATION=-
MRLSGLARALLSQAQLKFASSTPVTEATFDGAKWLSDAASVHQTDITQCKSKVKFGLAEGLLLWLSANEFQLVVPQLCLPGAATQMDCTIVDYALSTGTYPPRTIDAIRLACHDSDTYSLLSITR